MNYKGWHRITEATHCTGAQYIELKKEKTVVFCDTLPIEQACNVRCILDSSWDTTGFVTSWVNPYQTWVLARDRRMKEWRRCSAWGQFPTDFQFCSEGSYWLMTILFNRGHESIDVYHCARCFWLPTPWFELHRLSAIQEHFIAPFNYRHA